MSRFNDLLRSALGLLGPERTNGKSHRRSPRSRLLAVEALEDRTVLSTFVVDSASDISANDGATTLREAIVAANQNPGHDTIVFAPSLSGQTITISQVFGLGIHDDLTITGPGADQLTITRNVSSGEILSHDSSLELGQLTIANSGPAPGNFPSRLIVSRGDLTVQDVTFRDNRYGAIEHSAGALLIDNSRFINNRGSHEGAILLGGNLIPKATIIDSVFENNHSAGDGGAIRGVVGDLTVIGSSFKDNSAANNGGAILIARGPTIFGTPGGGHLDIINSTFTGNSAGGSGGAIISSGFNDTLTVTNSTFTGNSAQISGGAISQVGFSGTVTVSNSTIVLNQADSDNNATGCGGGIFITSPGNTTLNNTIVAGNLRGAIASDLAGNNVSAASNNLIGDAASSGGLLDTINGNIVGVDGAGVIDLATILDNTLADNGGPTLTHALIPGSPAIDAGSNSLIPSGITSDQRGAGFPRIIGPSVDIGAFEAELITNNAPIALNDPNYSTGENSPLVVPAANGVLANDSDPDAGDTIAVIGNTATSGGGLVSMNADGSFTYDPNGQFDSLAVGESTTDSFQYTIADGAGGTATATVTITILGENDAPIVASRVAVTSHEDAGSFEVNLLTGASDADASDTLGVTGLTHTGGDASGVSASGNSLTVDPAAYNHLAVGESEVITFSYSITDGNGGTVAQTATITIEGRNDAPAVADFALTGAEDNALGFSAADFNGSFSDPDGDALAAVRIETLPAGGALVLGGAEVTAGQAIAIADLDNLIFVPDINFHGETSFTYSASDGIAFALAPATVTLDILSAAEQTDVLDAKIDALLAAGIINEGQAESLKLNLKDNNGDAGKVQAFLYEVEAFVLGGILTEEQAAGLLHCGHLLLISVTTG